jgi:diaminopimelate decarboxylase
LRQALAEPGLIDAEDSAALFHDLSFMAERCRAAQRAFPENALHTLAIKANPLVPALRRAAHLGMGMEAASLVELHLALAAGVAPSRIVFDSPVKTEAELALALEKGVHINADSLEELARIARLRQARASESVVGLRVNPQIGIGVIAQTSVAGGDSKFGAPVNEQRAAIIAAFESYPWLSALHVHIGSQGCKLPLLVSGVSAVFALAQEINRRWAAPRIRVFDVGGGLPVAYRDDETPPTVAEYAQALRRAMPELFTPSWRLITEFGRFIQANAGWVASRIEYVKAGAQPTLVAHVGADLFLRRCYRPEDWHHDLFLTDGAGRIKTGPTRRYTVAGPLCFAGDVLARQLALPEAQPGDFLIIRDAGAYTLSMWSRYNSRQIPKVIGYDGDGFTLLRRRESLTELAAFWGA